MPTRDSIPDDKHGHRPLWPLIGGIAIPVVLLAAYLGAYIQLTRVVRIATIVMVPTGGTSVATVQWIVRLDVTVPDPTWARWLIRGFAPLEAVDRRLRPEVWNPR